MSLAAEYKIALGILAGGTVLGGAALVRSWHRKTKAEREAKKRAEDAAKNAVIESEAWSAQGEKPSFPPSQYTALADTIETAVKGPWYDPTDEDAIYQAFGVLVNNQDFLALQGAYVAKGETLTQAIRGDMNSTEIGKVNSILQGKGIVYRF